MGERLKGRSVVRSFLRCFGGMSFPFSLARPNVSPISVDPVAVGLFLRFGCILSAFAR
jgi:hypothetical protein